MGGRAQRRDWPPDQIVRLLKLERVPGVRVGALCAEHGVSPRRLRRWREEFAAEARWTEDGLVLAAFHHSGGPLSLESVTATVDWMDHASCSPAEIEAKLRHLADAGWVVATDAGWMLVRAWP